tara:strand:- start:421 stop:1041 length:621 start_codon:yes stop_codon:yes gene_type:complete
MRKGKNLLRPIIRSYTINNNNYGLPNNWKEMTPKQKIKLVDQLEIQREIDINYKNNDLIPSIIKLEKDKRKDDNNKELMKEYYYDMLLDSNEVINDYNNMINDIYENLDEDYNTNKKTGGKKTIKRKKRRNGKTRRRKIKKAGSGRQTIDPKKDPNREFDEKDKELENRRQKAKEKFRELKREGKDTSDIEKELRRIDNEYRELYE